MTCIFCDNKLGKEPTEHIVPESLGNDFYILKPTTVCGSCNARFSKFEGEAISKSILGYERARLGVKTKKGKPGTGEVDALKFTANSEFKKNYIVADGLTNEHVVGTDPTNKTFQVKVKNFNNNEMSTSKLVLKIGLESLSQSQNKIFKSCDFSELKEYMTNKSNKDWPFINSCIECHSFKSVVTFYDKHQLKYLECNLTFSLVDKVTLLFKFRYGGVKYIVNLINRQIKWTHEYFENDKECRLYPKHMSPK